MEDMVVGGLKGIRVGRGQGTSTRSGKETYTDFIPCEAQSIAVPDVGAVEPPPSLPSRPPGPQLPDTTELSAVGHVLAFYFVEMHCVTYSREYM